MRKIKFIWLLFFCPIMGFSQSLDYPKKFFQPLWVNGKINFEGGYRYLVGTTNEIYNYQKTPVLSGGILLNTSSYFWHPRFLVFDLGGEYNPGLRWDDYLVIPDQSESRTYEGFNAAVGLFRGKSITLGAFVNYNDGYANRENMANIRTKGLTFGANLLWTNKILPVDLHYDQGKSDENEIGTGREYKTYHEQFQGRITRSFSTFDRHEFIYYHNDNRRKDQNYPETRNISDNFDLSDHIYFDRAKNHYFSSLISGTDQRGTDTFKRLQAIENLYFKLPHNLKLTGNYSYSNINRPSQSLIQNNVSTSLTHQLFESLTTSVTYEYNRANQTYYQETRNKAGIDFKYQKKLTRGWILLGYSYYLQNLKHNSDSYQLQVLDEEHNLADGKMELLDKPDPILLSVVITDNTGIIIYQIGLDYILIQRNAYIEIQRVPGGQISNNASVMVDYMVNQQGTYEYNVNFITFNASLSLFERLVELYYRGSWQDYNNLKNTENVILDYIRRNIYGLKLQYKFASAGVEYEDYNSSITPYTLWNYFAQLQGNIFDKVGFSLIGNLHNYHMLYNNTYQTNADVTGNIVWETSPRTKLNTELGYRKQVGEGIGLDLITFKTEFTANYRKLYITAGVELYRRIYLAEKLNYYNVYVKLVRNFNWNKR